MTYLMGLLWYGKSSAGLPRSPRHWRHGAGGQWILLISSGLVATLAACFASGARAQNYELHLSTTAFPSGGRIPPMCTCDGPDASPPLVWSEPPLGTQSFVLIMDDPDAPGGTFVHWVVYNLSPGVRRLPAGLPPDPEISRGGRHGRNDFGKLGYGGPCPPPGKPHRYFFKLYALDTRLNPKPGATKAEVERTMKGHVLAQGELVGHYGR